MPMHVVIVGGGKVGASLASLLTTGSHEVTLIEVRTDKIAELRHDLPRAAVIEGSGTDPNVLESVGIRRAQVVAAVTGQDEVNLVVTTLARFEFAVPRTVARVNNPKNAWPFTAEMGVDVAVNQADLMAHLIAEEMSLGEVLTLLKLRKGQYALVEEEVQPDAVAAGRAVSDLSLPAECVLAGIIHGGQLGLPRPELVLQPGDHVLAVAHSSALPGLARVLGHPASPADQ